MGSTNEWQPMFSVGHPLLDEQHRRLLALAQRASACLADSSGESAGEFHLILNDLMEYARQHFRSEEQLLREFGYAGLAAQLAEHQVYLDRLVGFMTAAMDGIIDKQGLQQYLVEWWMRHILVSDMQFRTIFGTAPAAPV